MCVVDVFHNTTCNVFAKVICIFDDVLPCSDTTKYDKEITCKDLPRPLTNDLWIGSFHFKSKGRSRTGTISR